MYKVRIKGPNDLIVAELPEDGISLTIEQEWENPFKIELDPKLQAAVQMITGLIDRRWGTGKKSAVWNHNLFFTYMGGSPLQLSIPLIFVAERSVSMDIVEPVKSLMKLSCPSDTSSGKAGKLGGLLTPPPEVSISIGKFLRLQNCIITNVNADLMAPLVSGVGKDFKGAPMRIPVVISVMTKRIVTRSVIDNALFTGRTV